MYVIHDREQYKSGRTDQDAVWGMNLGGGKELYYMGCTLAPNGEYD